MEVRLIRKDFKEKDGVKMGYEKGVRHSWALGKNEDIIAAWKTSCKYIIGILCSAFKKYIAAELILKELDTMMKINRLQITRLEF